MYTDKEIISTLVEEIAALRFMQSKLCNNCWPKYGKRGMAYINRINSDMVAGDLIEQEMRKNLEEFQRYYNQNSNP